ncbi:hypothetical protein KAW96_03765 [candidate division WOR-3 bacterium]|nr:hypothetical protein [candidate division WOR-3 bacterium]
MRLPRSLRSLAMTAEERVSLRVSFRQAQDKLHGACPEPFVSIEGKLQRRKAIP